MQPFQGSLFRVTLMLVAILGIYAMNYFVVPRSLPNFQQWVFPSFLGSSKHQPPTNMIIDPTPDVSPDASPNSTSLLPLDNETTKFENHEVVMVTPSTSNLTDLDQSLVIQGFTRETNVNSKKSVESDVDKGTNKRKKGPILQGDDDQLSVVIQEEKNNVSKTSNDDLGFQIEDTNAWLGLEEHMDNNTKAKLQLNTTSKKEETLVEGGCKENEYIGAEVPLSSTTTPLPSRGIFKGRSTPWLLNVATLLSKCASTTPIEILEYLANKPCPRNCSGHGVCNYDLAKCQCFHGYTGAGCNLDKEFECNIKYSINGMESQGYFGPWSPSICSATCDKRKGFCYCGEGTKYPRRPVVEQCGFLQIPYEHYTFNWTMRDPDIFTNNSNRPGWCNVDPTEYSTGKVQRKRHCYCVYDGADGELCELHTESTCVNQCSRNGFCQEGFCACEEGWYGIDCSIPSAKALVKTWPSWLSSGRVLNSHHPLEARYQELNKVIVERHRPLIYVYDLPTKFNSLLLEGRHFKFHCVNRIYDAKNMAIWPDALYGAEMAFLESLLLSKHRTTNAEEADFFYVPVLGACATSRAGDAPHMDLKRRHYGVRPYFVGDMYYKKAYHHITKSYPYWDRYDGRDHIWMFAWDEGACVSPKEIWNSMMLVHWGNTFSKYNYSTTAYVADNWGRVPKYWRGNHACYDPKKDLVLPSWKKPDVILLEKKLWMRKIDQRPTLFYFRGNLGSKFANGRPEPKLVPTTSQLCGVVINALEGSYSMGIRQRIAEEFATEANLEGHMGRQLTSDVKVFSQSSAYYSSELASSRFCGVFPGDGWSGRMEDSILHGCIPVIIQDGIHLAYENVLDYSKFAVRISEKKLPQMVHILRGIPEETVNAMQSVVQTLRQRFTYHTPIQSEVDRQKRLGKSPLRSWTEFTNLKDDDAFDTFIQVLHYKLIQRGLEMTSKHSQNDSHDVNCCNFYEELKP